MGANVLLIQSPEPDHPGTNFGRRYRSYPPLGLMYIGTLLKQHGHAVKLVDLSVIPMGREAFAGLVDRLQPDIVGISVQACGLARAIPIATVVKERRPDALLLFGGNFPTFTFRDLLSEHPQIDCVGLHEGEYTMLELAERVAADGHPCRLDDIAGLALRDDEGSIVTTAARPPIPDLDVLPFPDRNMIRQEVYSNFLTISTARGCPASCIFCSSRAFWGHGVRLRKAAAVVDEIKHLKRLYPEQETFWFIDDTLTADVERAIAICEGIVEARLGMQWGCLSRVDVMSERLIRALRAAGCYTVKYGIESGSDEVLRRIGKRITVAQAEEAMRMTREHGLAALGSVVLGLPGDTKETMRQTIEFAVRLRDRYGCHMQIGINTPFPGTPEGDRPDAFGLTIHHRNWRLYDLQHPVISGADFTRDDLASLFYDGMHRIFEEIDL